MRILMTADSYLPRLGGGEYHVYYLRRGLRQRGHHVDLLVSEAGYGTAQPAHVDDEADVTRVPLTSRSSYVSLARRLWSLSKKADLIHSHYSFRLAALSAIVATLRKKPFVVTQHGMGLLPPSRAPSWQLWVFRLWRFMSMRAAVKVISTSEELGSVIASLGFGHKIVSIPNGYDAEAFRPASSSAPAERRPAHSSSMVNEEEEDRGTPLAIEARASDGPRLLTVRRLVPKTGIQYLIQALPELRARHPGLRLICIGEGRYRERLQSLADELEVSEAVDFKGAIPHSDLPSHYERADVVVLPSTAESTSLTCIEALATGTPVVASRVGGLIELIGSNEERGFLVPLFDDSASNYEAAARLGEEKIHALASAISTALTRRELSQAKSERAVAYVPPRFSWETVVGRTISEVYETVHPA